MSKLQLLAKTSDLMKVVIKYGDETIIFNLYQEAKIDENTINKEVTIQPNSFGFLGLLLKRLIRRMDDAQAEMERVYARKFVINKENELDSTGKVPSDDLAHQMVIEDKDYQKAKTAFLKAKEEVGIIEVCHKTFEQRASLIQTLAANIRKSN